ncbi:M14 metallopeptidase family protein [Chromatocurvus halotolerans]|uniref:Zinc carboxypeptidase n=1 Tax=Chromatocurvus halotolerans TaxID=1132028 RepID=A0A4R2L9C9_9GAMM|nr:M14 metallopeptidase family protein [Chromatocurvus halotolerans]TCO75845.1 zinc carboxypeptidase [Chromatocurvus halotolerans]
MSSRVARYSFILVFLPFILCHPVFAESLWPAPEVSYRSDIPSVESVLDYPSGHHITWSADVTRYFEALQEAAPQSVKLVPYATSWEGRELFYAVISAPENMQRLEEIRANMHRLRDPRSTSAVEASAIAGNTPAVTWLAYGVHGNEISSSDAAMATAYHLLASKGDARVASILENSVVIIAPVQNPDGRDRFIARYMTARGLQPDADPLSAEHNEPWPSGRTNHYLFDLNRDWFIRTQPETRGHADAVLEWLPVAFVDLHEMGSNSTYFFAPEAEPYNPHLVAGQRSNLERFGRNNAKWFDRFGVDYFTREVFDAFYPGYGASWPSYFGSTAMTYEQASARGQVVRRDDGELMTFRDTVRNHMVTSLATAETVATNREQLLTDFYEYQVTAVREGRSGSIRSYILPPQDDQAGVDRLASLLVAQGVEVGRAEVGFSACGRRYPRDSIVIDLAQPAKRLVRTLMDAQVEMPEEFIAEQERLQDKRLPDVIYDVTAWSLPLMLNVQADACEQSVVAATRAVGVEPPPGAVAGGPASVAYLVPWGSRPAIRFLSAALQAGMLVNSADEAFVIKDREYPGGTLILPVRDDAESLHAQVASLAEQTGAQVIGLDTSWVTEGPSFGSRKVVRMLPPRVAIAWDVPTRAYAAGNTRFVIERQFDYPVTAIRTADLASADLSRYQVLVLPETGSAGYAGVLGESGRDSLRRWVERGGVLLTLGNATRLAADPAADMLAIRREHAALPGADADGNPAAEDPAPAVVPGTNLDEPAYAEAIRPREVDPESLGGALLQATVDPDHWLGAGVARELQVLARGSDIYTPIRLDKGVNVARFAGPDTLLASGHVWPANRRQLAYKPFVVAQPVGAGFVIAFTQDPTVRAYLDGLNTLFMNAIFRAAAHARPVVR